MLLLPKFIAGFSGAFVDANGYASFFAGTALLGVPVLLIWLAGRPPKGFSLGRRAVPGTLPRSRP